MSTRHVGLACVVLAIAACSPKDEAATDSTAAAAAAAPAPLTPAALAGTWAGQTMGETGDSVTGKFTIIAKAEGGGQAVFEGSKDTLTYTSTFDADSSVATSAPYIDPTMPKGTPQVMFKAVARMIGENKMGGMTTLVLASKPDSVIGRGRWEATRQ